MNSGKMPQIDLFVWIIFLIITTFGIIFRFYLHFNNILQFIGNSLGNIGGVIVISYLFFWWIKEGGFWERKKIILYVGVGLIVYEFIQVFIPWQTFDIQDILGTFIGVLIASFLDALIFIFIIKNSD